MVVENSIKSQKPVEIGDLRVPSDSGSGEAAKEVQARAAEAVRGDP